MIHDKDKKILHRNTCMLSLYVENLYIVIYTICRKTLTTKMNRNIFGAMKREAFFDLTNM